MEKLYADNEIIEIATPNEIRKVAGLDPLIFVKMYFLGKLIARIVER